ncbi:alpha/beta hydrolase [Patescibacteria group bacterium]|nr:alpha/beta hydrolase [Patescibacteria group bacterium]
MEKSLDNFLGGASNETSGQIKGLKSIEIDGQKVSYIERGNPKGKPLLYIGGWISSVAGDRWFLDTLEGNVPNSKGLQTLRQNSPGSAEGIEKIVRSLKDKYRIIDLELPGFGGSESLEGKIDLNRMADFVARFQESIGMGGSYAFGSSMGGIVGVKLASRHPEMVKALVVQGLMTKPDDMDTKVYYAGQVATRFPINALLKLSGFGPKVLEALSKGSKDFKMSNSEAQKAIVEGARRADINTALSTLREIGRDIGEDIEKVQCPVIVMDGANGDLVPIMNSAKASLRFHPETPNSEKVAEKKVIFLPVGGRSGEHGHNIVNTFPEGAAALIDDVMSKVA